MDAGRSRNQYLRRRSCQSKLNEIRASNLEALISLISTKFDNVNRDNVEYYRITKKIRVNRSIFKIMLFFINKFAIIKKVNTS